MGWVGGWGWGGGLRAPSSRGESATSAPGPTARGWPMDADVAPRLSSRIFGDDSRRGARPRRRPEPRGAHGIFCAPRICVSASASVATDGGSSAGCVGADHSHPATAPTTGAPRRRRRQPDGQRSAPSVRSLRRATLTLPPRLPCSLTESRVPPVSAQFRALRCTSVSSGRGRTYAVTSFACASARRFRRSPPPSVSLHRHRRSRRRQGPQTGAPVPGRRFVACGHRAWGRGVGTRRALRSFRRGIK